MVWFDLIYRMKMGDYCLAFTQTYTRPPARKGDYMSHSG